MVVVVTVPCSGEDAIKQLRDRYKCRLGKYTNNKSKVKSVRVCVCVREKERRNYFTTGKAQKCNKDKY